MKFSENLNLKLPEGGDTLEVSDLSENFEALDEALGGGESEIIKSMAIGDITYSTRNLEAESGGQLIACDQRTIDITAYPGIPEAILYWPYPEVVMENVVAPDSGASTSIKIYGVPSLNTAKFKYISGYDASSSIRNRIVIYDEDAGTVFRANPNNNQYNSVPENSKFIRISDDWIISSGNVGSSSAIRYYHNDLTTYETHASSDSNAANYISGRNGYLAGVYKLPNGRLLLLTQRSSYVGVRYTDDDFSTVVTSSVPTSMLTAIGKDPAITGTEPSISFEISSPFHPVIIDDTGIYVIAYPAIGTSYISSISADTIRSAAPEIYHSSDNGGSFELMPVADGLTELLTQFFEDTGSKYIYIHTCFRAGGHVYIKYKDGSNSTSRQLYVAINIESNSVDNSLVGDFLQNNQITNSNMEFWVYDNNRNTIYSYDGTELNKIGLNTLQEETLSTIFHGGSTQPKLIGTGCWVMETKINIDTRLKQKGFGGPVSNGLRIVDQDHFVPGKSEVDASTLFKLPTISVMGTDGIALVNVSSVTTMTEYNGDIYVLWQTKLYKIPANKKQLPYIENGYIKVLNDEGVSE